MICPETHVFTAPLAVSQVSAALGTICSANLIVRLIERFSRVSSDRVHAHVATETVQQARGQLVTLAKADVHVDLVRAVGLCQDRRPLDAKARGLNT